MNNVDNRVVSLRFDNSGFSQKISETRKSLEKLNDDLKLEGAEEGSSRLQSFFDKVKGTFKHSNTGINEFDDDVNKISESFSKLEVVAVGALMEIGRQAVNAGEKIVKSLTIDQVKSGFDKYSKILSSTQTILAADESLTQDQVSAALDKLTWYTDETSYAMTNMVDAISDFTSQGIKLEDAVNYMIGVANAAAKAGSGVDRANYAFTAFARAMGQGYVSLGLWNNQFRTSNIRTAEFKQTAIDAAVSLGKLKKDANGVVKTLDEKYVVSVGNFEEALSKAKWFDIDVIESVLSKYSKSIDDIYEKYADPDNDLNTSQILDKFGDSLDKFSTTAFRLAQEATTFEQAVDSLFDAMSSRIKDIFTLIFGNYEQAKELWTGLANWLYDTFIGPVDTIYDKIEELTTTFVRFTKNTKTGLMEIVTVRDELISGISNIFKFIYNSTEEVDSVIEVLKEAWSEVFEIPTNFLVELVIRFKQWTDRLLNNKQLLDRIKRIFKDIFKILKFVKNILVAIGSIIKKIIWPIVKVIFSFILDVAEIILTIITAIADGIGGVIGSIFGWKPKIKEITQVTSDAKDAVMDAKDAVTDTTKALDGLESALSDVADAEDEVTEKSKKATKNAKKQAEATAEIADNLEAAVQSGKVLSDENYIYTPQGLTIPKHVDIKEGSVLGGIQKIIDAIKSIGTGTTEVEKKIQNSFKDAGKGIEKTFTKVTNSAKTISKNGLLYKSSEGIRKLTNNIFDGINTSFRKTKENIINTSNSLKGMFDIFHKNRTKKSSIDIIPGVSKSSLTLSNSISKVNKKNQDTVNTMTKNTESLIDEYNKAAEQPDKLTKVGTGIANLLSNTLGYATTKILTGVLKLTGEDTSIITEKTLSTDEKIKEIFSKISTAVAKGVTSVSWGSIKNIFLNLWDIIKGLTTAIKNFFKLFKKDEEMMSSSSSSSMTKVEKKAKTIWDIFNGIIKAVADFVERIKYSINTFSLYDKKTGELKDWVQFLISGIEIIKNGLKLTGFALEIIFNALRAIKFEDFKSGWDKFVESVKNSRIYKFFSNLRANILLLLDDIQNFGFGQAFTNAFDRIKESFGSLKEKIIKGFEELNTNEFWEGLGDKKSVSFIAGLVKNLVGILSKALKYAVTSSIDIIFSKMASYMTYGTTEYADEFRNLTATVINDEWVSVSTWDKLKYIFSNIFSGALWNDLLQTEAMKFITWFADTLFGTIGEKIRGIADTIKSIFKPSKEEGIMSSSSSSSSSTKDLKNKKEEMTDIQKDIEKASIKSEGINWDKILGATVFVFSIARIVSAWKFFIQNTAGDKKGVSSIASSVAEIGKSFAGIAIGTTVLAIAAFAAALFMFVKAMDALSLINTTGLEKNFNILSKCIDQIGAFVIIIMLAHTLLGLFDIFKDTKVMNPNKGAINIQTNPFMGIAGMIFAITMGIAAILFALAKLAEVDVTKLDPIMKKIWITLGIIFGSIIILALITGIASVKTAANTAVPQSIDMGKFNMGNIFQSITNKSPLAGLPDLIKNMATLLLAILGAYVGLIAVFYIIEKLEPKTNIVAKARGALILIFVLIGALIGLIMTGIGLIIKKTGAEANLDKILGNFALVILSIGVALSLLFLSIGGMIKKIATALTDSKGFNDVLIIGTIIAIMVLVFKYLIEIIELLMNSVLKVAGMVDGDETKAKNLEKVLKAFAKIIKMIISPFKWIFAGIGLMVKLMSKADGKQLLSAVAIVGFVMFGLVKIIKEVSHLLETILNQVKTEKGNVSAAGSRDLTKIFKSIMGILITILAATAIIFGLVALLAGVIDRMKDPDRMWTAIFILGIVFLGVIGALYALVGVLAILKKIKLDPTDMGAMTGALIIFMIVVGVLAATMFAMIMHVIKTIGDNPETFKEAGLSVIAIFGAIALLLLLFMAFVVIVDKIKVDVKTIALIALTLGIFALVVVGIAGAFMMMAGAFDKVGEEGFKKIRNALFAMIGIFVLIAVIAGLVGATGVGELVVIAIVGIAGAFFLFGLALLAIAGAFYIFAAAFAKFFETLKKLPELIPSFQEFLVGLREQILPEIRALLLGIQEIGFALVRGFIFGIWDIIMDGLRYWNKHAPEAVDLIVDTIVAIIDGLAEGATRIDTALTNLFTTIGNIIERHWNNLVSRVQGWFDDISDNAVVGFIQGIGSRIGDLWNSGEEMGDAVKEGAQDSLDSHSPSRFMEWLGKMAVKGLENGIGDKNEQSGLYKTATKLKDTLMGALNPDDEESSGILDGLTNKLQGFLDNQDLTATVNAVLNMDDLTSQMNNMDLNSMMNTDQLMGNMNGMMDTSQLMDTSSAFSNMQMASMDTAALQNGTSDITNVTNMTQNNYSPTTIDSATQYRQSKNLVDASFAQDKQAWGFRQSRRVDTGKVTAGGHPIYKYQK